MKVIITEQQTIRLKESVENIDKICELLLSQEDMSKITAYYFIESQVINPSLVVDRLLSMRGVDSYEDFRTLVEDYALHRLWFTFPQCKFRVTGETEREVDREYWYRYLYISVSTIGIPEFSKEARHMIATNEEEAKPSEQEYLYYIEDMFDIIKKMILDIIIYGIENKENL